MSRDAEPPSARIATWLCWYLLSPSGRNSHHSRALTSSPFPLLSDTQRQDAALLNDLQWLLDVFPENSKASSGRHYKTLFDCFFPVICHTSIIIPNLQQKQLAGFFPNKNRNASLLAPPIKILSVFQVQPESFLLYQMVPSHRIFLPSIFWGENSLLYFSLRLSDYTFQKSFVYTFSCTFLSSNAADIPS